MDTYNISDVDKLKNLFEQAFSSCSDEMSENDYDEYIALLAEGNIEKLPVNVRAAVLEQISYDPDSAQILKDISEQVAATHKTTKITHFRVLSISWALAACMMFGVFAWRIADPVPSANTIDRPGALSTEGHNHWDDLNKQRLASQETRYKVRDYALTGSVIATCLLSAAILAEKLKKTK